MQETPPRPDRPLIFVVDDDGGLRKSLQFFLELEGFSVRAYANAAEVIRDPRLGDCRCLVIDQRLPGLSGLELLQDLRGRHVDAPAILMTSHPSEATRAAARDAGVSIVEKPLLSNALGDEIKRVLQLNGYANPK